MGQRVQILLNLIDNQGNASTTLVHNQWGIGRILPEIVLTYLGQVSRLSCYSAEEFMAKFKKAFVTDRYDVTDELTIPEQDYVDIKDLIGLKELLQNQDNNNGWAVIQIVQDSEKSYNFDVTIGYLLGSEDLEYDYEKGEYVGEEPFDRYVSVHEWMMRTWGDYNKETATLCNDFFKGYKYICKSFGYEHITGTLDNLKVSKTIKPYEYKVRHTEE